MSASNRPWLIARAGRKTFIGAGAVSGLIVVTVILSLLGGGESAIFDPTAIDTSGLDGQTLFAASCARCHGSNLQGSQTGPPLLADMRGLSRVVLRVRAAGRGQLIRVDDPAL